jgi:hypothetical protein
MVVQASVGVIVPVWEGARLHRSACAGELRQDREGVRRKTQPMNRLGPSHDNQGAATDNRDPCETDAPA